jgi:hypothetical protein
MKKFLKLCLPAIIVLVALAGIMTFVFKNVKKPKFTVESEAFSFVEKISKMNLVDGYYSVLTLDRSGVSVKPDEGWVKVKSGAVEDFTFYYVDAKTEIPYEKRNIVAEDFYSNCYFSRVGKKTYYKELTYSNFVKVNEFGAVGDGQTNDTESIRNAVKEVNEKGGVLLFPYGTYKVSVDGDELRNGADKSTVVKITTDKDVIVDFCGSTMTLDGTHFPNNKLVYAYNCTGSVEVKNGTLIGDRKTHNYKAILNDKGEVSSAQGAYSHCFGHGVGMRNTRDGLVLNMEVYDMTGDAVYIKNGKISQDTNQEYKTVVESCVLHHCRRQGITIGDSDLTIVKDTEIYKIGHADEYTNDDCQMDEGSVVNAVEGQSPMSGIDVEPDSGSFWARLVQLDNVHIHTCSSFGVVGNKGEKVGQGIIDGIEIKNSIIETFEMDYAKIFNSEIRQKSEERSKVASLIKKCEIKDSKIIKDFPFYETFFLEDNVFENCVFESVAEDNTTTGVFLFQKDNTVKNCVFRNLRGTGEGSTTHKGYGVVLYLEDSFNEYSGYNIFENCDLMIRDPHHIKNTRFKNCAISLGYPNGEYNATDENPLTISFTDVVFDNCVDRYVSTRNALVMTNCIFCNMKKESIFKTIGVAYINCKEL